MNEQIPDIDDVPPRDGYPNNGETTIPKKYNTGNGDNTEYNGNPEVEHGQRNSFLIGDSTKLPPKNVDKRFV